MNKPVLGARWLIEHGADAVRSVWRIDGDALGRLLVHPHNTAVPPAGDLIALIDITIHPWRRRLQRAPATPAVARALVASAADEFPFPPEATRYAIGFDGDEAWLCAINEQDLARLAQPGQRLQAVLLAAPGAAGAQAALRHYRRYGAACDFLGRSQRLIFRHALRLAGRGLALLGALALLLGLLLSDRWPAWLLARQVAGLESEAADIVRRKQTVQRMQAAQSAIAELHASPAARLPEILERAFASIPAGHLLSRIDYRNGTLTLGGTGPQGRDWLLGLGVPDAAIHVESVGSYHHFRAEFNPEQIRRPAEAAPAPISAAKEPQP